MTALTRLYKISIAILFVFNLTAAADIPDGNDINFAIEQSRARYQNFLKQSLMTRMQMEYKGRFFTDDDKENLLSLAQKTSTQLDQLIESQEKLRHAIEDYVGDDWEQRFGQNRLFRKLVNNISLTKSNKLRTDFVKAIASDDYNKNKAFKDILKTIELRPNSPASDLIKAKIYANLAKVDSAYFDTAKKELLKIRLRSDISQRIGIESSIEYYKLTQQRDSILNYQLPKPLANNLELMLPVVFLQRKLDENAFEKAILKQPAIKPILGSLVLAYLNSDAEFEDVTTFETNLAALSAWRDGAEKYSKLLARLCSADKSKTPVMLYVSAISCANDRPEESVTRLIDASKMQDSNFDKMLKIAPAKIASQGCLLAYKTFAKKKDNEELTTLTFENYFQLAEASVDPKIKYIYCDVLGSLGQKDRSLELLKEISDDPVSPYRCQAKYDLIVEDMQGRSQAELIEKLEELIYDCREAGQTKIELQATKIYCRTILDVLNKDTAEKALTLLESAKVNLDDEIFAFKAKAYLLTDRFIESARTMLELQGNCDYYGQVLDIFEKTANGLDAMQYEQDNLELEGNCRKVFEAFDGCFDKSQKSIAWLYLAEISIFSNHSNAIKLKETEKQLNSGSVTGYGQFQLLRCRARLAMYQEKFAQAGQLWGKLCDLSRNNADMPIRMNNLWWQGKYYQLYCFKKSPNAKQSELLHIIEVLQRTYPDMDRFWALKISALK